ncbi:SGNH/GDSL hydrolase family protein [Furfurilactobacillus entadae]|uniref:SGNH/GDSL hydrolase family protein n=1 Tax=Furfurilactobacillus entadae TaxID=2922307 RepID=UPI0035E676EF
MKLVMLGDSITQGWDGYKDVQYPASVTVAQRLGISVTNLGHGGGAIIGERKNDLTASVASCSFADYDIVTVAYGINDFNQGTGTLATVTETLTAELARIRAQTATIQLVGILPMWGNIDAVKEDQNQRGISFTAFQDALATTYQAAGGVVLDWRVAPIVTAANAEETLADHWLHPNQATYNKVGARIADVIHTTLTI